MTALDFYEGAFGQPEVPVTSLVRYQARLLAGRSHEEAVTSNGSPEAMVASTLPVSWPLPGRGDVSK